MRIPLDIQYLDIVQLDVEERIDTFQRPLNLNIILQVDSNDLVHQGLEEAVEEHGRETVQKWASARWSALGCSWG